ncbi:recombinase family protein [Hymenobacter sp. BT683]|uniref:Recombinase family protein n=1 Tax=Hymenobacter jeongseonensis TaxID=2791027 RepID=A0ABS0IH07_9BACT|nr:recombinase family protein [Hymenobacter jeongseonensis]MBF9237462.1 recombinase family protein [Hymenobacter jeongseonensis]
MQNFVAYYRVSTVRQGESGLGLEAQQATVLRHVAANAGTISSEYIEVESGKKNNRPKLMAALAEAKATSSTLIIAKLDRLSRNASFLLSLMDAGVNFVAVDNPHANPLTLGLLAVIAQHEAKQISTRTREALAAKKRRGERLGSPANMTADARATSLLVRQSNARQAAVQVTDIIADKRQLGWTLQRVAEHLTAKGYTTRRGHPWTAGAVHRLVQTPIPA